MIVQLRSRAFIDEHAGRWVAAGIISREQVEEILRFEAAAETQVGPRLSLPAELAVYLGSVLALMGGTVIVGRTWEDLPLAARLSVGFAVALVGFIAGRALIRIDDRGSARLGAFLWLIGTGGVALTLVTILDRWSFEEEAWNAVGVGVPVMAIGALLWRNLDRPLQFLTTGVGLGLTLGGLAAVLDVRLWVGAFVAWAVAIMVSALALDDRIQPSTFVLAFASVAAIVAANGLGELDERLGPAFAALTAAVVVAVGLVTRRTTVLVIGVLGSVQSLAGVIATSFSGPVGSVGISLVGLVIVIGVLTRQIRGGPTPTS